MKKKELRQIISEERMKIIDLEKQIKSNKWKFSLCKELLFSGITLNGYENENELVPFEVGGIVTNYYTGNKTITLHLHSKKLEKQKT